MILLNNYYVDKNPKRQSELDACMEKNLRNRLINHIIVFKNRDVMLKPDKKIIPVNIDRRPTYSDYFRIGNRYSGIKILANSDIYFDESLALCNMIESKQVFALCRWSEHDGSLEFYNRRDSQDVWVWRDSVYVSCDFGLGVPGCDNAIAFLLIQAGYKVISPSKKIKSIHLHNSGVRNYFETKNRVNPPYAYMRYF